MKKLILMTSALTFMGGAAYAGMDVTGKASVAYGNWGTGAAAAAFSFNTGIDIKLEESSGDLTYGAKVSIDADAGTVSDGVIWVSGGFGKASFGIDAFDQISEDVDNATDINGATANEDLGDVKYEGTFGAVKATLVADAGLGNTPTTAPKWWLGVDYDGGTWGAGVETDSLGASKVKANAEIASMKVAVSADSAGAWDLSVSRDFGAVNAKVTYDSAGKTGLALKGSAGNVSWKVAGDSAGGASASADYAMGDLSIGIAYDNADAGTAGVKDFGDAADLQLTVGYKMDMLDFGFKVNDQSEYELKMTAGFTF